MKQKLMVLAAALFLLLGTASAEVDSFEDGDYTNNPAWTEVEPDNLQVSQNVVFDGSYSFEATAAGNGEFV